MHARRRGLVWFEGLFGLSLGAASVAAVSAFAPIPGGASVPNAPLPGAAAVPPTRTPTTASVAPIGAEYDRDDAMKQHAEDVVDYTLRASLDPVLHTVHGEGTITWRNTSHVAVSEIWLHLYLNAFKNERTLFLRAPIEGGRGTGPVGSFGYIDVRKLVAPQFGGVDLWKTAEKTTPGEPEDQTDVRVPLPGPIEPGGTLTLEVEFEDELPRVVERTGYFGSFHMVAQWFPKLARLEPDGRWAHFPFYHLTEFYSDYGTYDVTIDVPQRFVVGATGSRVSETVENGRKALRYVQSDVHDFAFTAWDRFVERDATAGGVAIRCLFPPGYDAVAEREIATATFGLRRYGEAYGRYPYPTLTIVHPPAGADEAGGMEYPTMITTGGAWWTPPGIHSIEAVTLHELGHQWFYGLIGTNEEQWPMLDEGLNSYAETVHLAEMLGPGSYVDLAGLTIGDAEGQRVFAIRVGHDAPVAAPAPAFPSGADYGGLVYARTATIFQTFARVYGRAAVARGLGRYARRYRFEHPGLEELVAAMRDELGEAAERNLRAALLDRGWVDYRVASATSKPKAAPAGIFDVDGKRSTIEPGAAGTGGEWEGWALVMRHGTLEFPVEIELTSADGTTEVVPWDGEGDFVRVPYVGKSALTTVRVDPAASVWLDENLFDGAWRAFGGTRAPRTIERGTYGAELLLQAVMP